MWRSLQGLGQNLANTLLKPNCAMCGKTNDKLVCRYCDRQLTDCAQSEPLQTDKQLPPNTQLFAWGIYEQTLKQAIARCKYQNHPQIALHLGYKMGEAWQNHPKLQAFRARWGQLPVIPIPMHPTKLAQRGFNQAEELSKGFCAVTGLPHRPQWLKRVKNTKPQMQTTSKTERAENLAQAFQPAIPAHAKTERVILVDDIYTTGATMREAIESLASAGVKTVAIVILARPELELNSPTKSDNFR